MFHSSSVGAACGLFQVFVLEKESESAREVSGPGQHWQNLILEGIR